VGERGSLDSCVRPLLSTSHAFCISDRVLVPLLLDIHTFIPPSCPVIHRACELGAEERGGGHAPTGTRDAGGHHTSRCITIKAFVTHENELTSGPLHACVQSEWGLDRLDKARQAGIRVSRHTSEYPSAPYATIPFRTYAHSTSYAHFTSLDTFLCLILFRGAWHRPYCRWSTWLRSRRQPMSLGWCWPSKVCMVND
jgi:hypothetical protein